MIAVVNLTVRAGAFTLEDVSFAVGGGRYAVLMGKTGSGKTTILEALCGFKPIETGSVTLMDRDVTRLSPAERGIGYVPQGREIFPQLTVLENLQVGLLAHPQRLRTVPEYIFDYFPMLRTMLHRKRLAVANRSKAASGLSGLAAWGASWQPTWLPAAAG